MPGPSAWESGTLPDPGLVALPPPHSPGPQQLPQAVKPQLGALGQAPPPSPGEPAWGDTGHRSSGSGGPDEGPRTPPEVRQLRPPGAPGSPNPASSQAPPRLLSQSPETPAAPAPSPPSPSCFISPQLLPSTAQACGGRGRGFNNSTVWQARPEGWDTHTQHTAHNTQPQPHRQATHSTVTQSRHNHNTHSHIQHSHSHTDKPRATQPRYHAQPQHAVTTAT